MAQQAVRAVRPDDDAGSAIATAYVSDAANDGAQIHCGLSKQMSNVTTPMKIKSSHAGNAEPNGSGTPGLQGEVASQAR